VEAIAVLVVALASLGLVFGLINVIYPIKALRVRTRKWGLAISGGSLLLIIAIERGSSDVAEKHH